MKYKKRKHLVTTTFFIGSPHHHHQFIATKALPSSPSFAIRNHELHPNHTPPTTTIIPPLWQHHYETISVIFNLCHSSPSHDPLPFTARHCAFYDKPPLHYLQLQMRLTQPRLLVLLNPVSSHHSRPATTIAYPSSCLLYQCHAALQSTNNHHHNPLATLHPLAFSLIHEKFSSILPLPNSFILILIRASCFLSFLFFNFLYFFVFLYFYFLFWACMFWADSLFIGPLLFPFSFVHFFLVFNALSFMCVCERVKFTPKVLFVKI